MALRNIIDRVTKFGHYFIGTSGDDRMIGNGRAGVIFGGDGDDDINPGINTSGKLIQIYGGVSLPGFGHPDKGTAGRPGAVGGLHDDGDDIMHFGSDILAKGGSGNDTYIVHGPAPRSAPAHATHFNVHEDTLIFDHSDGWEIASYRTGGRYRDDEGDLVVNVHAVTLHGESKFQVHGQPGDQWIRLGFGDDGRGRHEPFTIEVDGKSNRDDVEQAFQDAFTRGGDFDFLFAG